MHLNRPDRLQGDTLDGWNLSLHERGGVHYFVHVLHVVLCTLSGGSLSLNIYGDVRHLVKKLQSRYLDRSLRCLSWKLVSANDHLVRELSGETRAFHVHMDVCRILDEMHLRSNNNRLNSLNDWKVLCHRRQRGQSCPETAPVGSPRSSGPSALCRILPLVYDWNVHHFVDGVSLWTINCFSPLLE